MRSDIETLRGLARRALPFALALLAASCSTIRDAREAEEIAAVSSGPASAAARSRVRLVGFQLADFVDFAMTNRPEVISAELAVETSLLAVKSVESGRPFMPNLTAGANYGQSTANRGSHFSWRNSGRFGANFGLELLLLDFGRYDAGFREACENLVAAGFSLAETKMVVFEEVAEAYFKLLMDDALLDVARTNEWECIHRLAQATNRFANGEAKQLDVLRARLDLSEAVQSLISASNETVVAGAEFLRTIGLSADRASREDVLPPCGGGLESMLMEFETSRSTIDEVLASARTNSPLLMMKRARLRAAAADVDWAVSDLFPELRLSSSFNFSDPSWNWSWAFEAVQSVFLGWRKTTAVDAAVVRMKSAQMEVHTTEQSLSRDLAVAVASRDDSVASLAAAKISVRQARENLRVADEQYRLGEASRIDCADAVADYVAALGRRVQAFYEGQLAETKILHLTGGEPLYRHSRVDLGDE